MHLSGCQDDLKDFSDAEMKLLQDSYLVQANIQDDKAMAMKIAKDAKQKALDLKAQMTAKKDALLARQASQRPKVGASQVVRSTATNFLFSQSQAEEFSSTQEF